MRKCKECEQEFEPFDEYDDTCFSCARQSETELNICCKCGEWFLDNNFKAYCKNCEDKENDSKDKRRNS